MLSSTFLNCSHLASLSSLSTSLRLSLYSLPSSVYSQSLFSTSISGYLLSSFTHALASTPLYSSIFSIFLSIYFPQKGFLSRSLHPPFLSLTSPPFSPDFPTSQLILSLFFSLLLPFFLLDLDFLNSSFHYFF